jgi:glycosyltransferase involved in cell wall biosynthesis
LATGLDRREWLPHVCGLAPAGALADRLVARGVAVDALNVRRAWDVPAAVVRLARLMRRVRPHIVHTMLFHANVIGRIAARLAGVSRVVSSIRVAERRYRHHLLLETLTCRLSQRVVCVSRDVARFTRRHSHVPAARLAVVPNGVESNPALGDSVAQSAIERPTGSITALYVGRLDPQKAVDVLLRAFARAVADVSNLHLVIAGTGPDHDTLQSLARQLGIERSVQFVGFHQNVPELMHAADFFVLPSRWEGMPNVVLEAMAAGLPVVATRTEGTAEIVRDGASGSLVAIDDDAALATQMTRLARDAELRVAWGSCGREIVQREYSIENMRERHAQIYRESIADG